MTAPRLPLIGLLGLLTFTLPAPASASAGDPKPNFVVIFIDDLGYGDIGPFGSKINLTPELDRMAAEGMKLTSFYVAAPVCTPSRAALMTGCYSQRIGLARGSDHAVLFPGDPHGLHPDELTIAEILKTQGYATGCFGKWHLGDQPGFLPNDQGFDAYFGIPYSNDMWPGHSNRRWSFPPLPLLRNRTVIGQVDSMADQGSLCRQFTDEAVRFIRRHRDRPFFVYLPHAFVHHPRAARPEFMNRAKRPIRDRPAPETRDRTVTRAQIEEIDWSVGEILKTLRELQLDQNTLVLFTSDNGGSRGCVNTPLRGGKGSAFEGGMRVGTLAWWPRSVPAGSANGSILTALDLLPTFASLAGAPLPQDRILDGSDITASLQGESSSTDADRTFFYYQQNRLRAVRSGPWKLFADGKLYHLETDLSESTDVAADHPEVTNRLASLLERARKDLGDGELKGANVRPVGRIPHSRTLVPRTGAEGEDAFLPTLQIKPPAATRPSN